MPHRSCCFIQKTKPPTVFLVNTASNRLAFSPYAGKTHDKEVADQEHIRHPKQYILRQDMGFQGYQPRVARLCQPKKATRR